MEAESLTLEIVKEIKKDIELLFIKFDEARDATKDHGYKIAELEKKGLSCIVWQEQDVMRDMIKDYKNNKALKTDITREVAKKIAWAFLTALFAVIGAGFIVLLTKYFK